MRARLRADLQAAMKAGRSPEARLLRAVVAALDNAEAPPARAGGEHRFLDGTAEVERLSLSQDRVRGILLTEIREREEAAAGMDRLARPDRAEALRAEALIILRYLG